MKVKGRHFHSFTRARRRTQTLDRRSLPLDLLATSL